MNPIYCIGSVLWDVIGRHPESQSVGFDKGGRISMLPGGVAMNIAMALVKLEQPVGLLTCLGHDPSGDALMAFAQQYNMRIDHIYRDDELPTDRYMAIETGGSLFAAIADAHSLERREADVIQPLIDGRLGSTYQPWAGDLVLDGNLTEKTLSYIASHGAFGQADIALAPASPGKALRLRPFLGSENVSIYVNIEEANILLDTQYNDSLEAAKALHRQGTGAAVVTNGGDACAYVNAKTAFTVIPPTVLVKRVTGAGDSFMAAHIAAKRNGLDAEKALHFAADYAAEYVSKEQG